MPPADPDLTPEQERAVRDLLAGARHDEPLPADVAARLDRTLTGLVEERAAGGSITGQAIEQDGDQDGEQDTGQTTGKETGQDRVVPLRSRRRKAVAGLLAAAAVVVVGGVAGVQALGGLEPPSVVSEDAASGGSDAGGDAAPPQESADEESAGESAGEDAQQDQQDLEPGGDASALRQQALPRVRSDRFDTDVRRLRAQAAAPLATQDDRRGRGANRVGSCAVREQGPSRLPVTWSDDDSGTSGQPAVLVYRRPVADRQRVDLLSCADGSILRSTEIPAR